MTNKFEDIYTAAKNKDYNVVRYILGLNLFTYREAQLYCERFKNDYEASKYIYNQIFCIDCGCVNNWKYNKKVMCPNCGLKNSLKNKIE